MGRDGHRGWTEGLRIVALLAVALVLAPVWVWAQDEKGNVVFSGVALRQPPATEGVSSSPMSFARQEQTVGTAVTM